MKTILELENIYFTYKGNDKYTLNNINLDVKEGETLGIIGESGSGKTTLLLSILGLLSSKGDHLGNIYFNNQLLDKEHKFKVLRWKEISMVFQNQLDVFNPKITVGEHIYEVLGNLKKKEKFDKVKELFKMVGLDEKFIESYPSELSGGMRQKVLIATALSCNPKLVLIDEPTTSLEEISKIEIIKILKNLAKNNITLIVTSHDLEIIKELTKKVIVMDSGNIIETGITKNFLSFQNHPYSRALVQASPFINIFKDLWGINEIETFRDINGCPFYSRCPQRISKCLYENPKLNKINEECQVACHLGGIINILEVNKLSKVYTSKKFKIEALSEVSLKVRMGEIVSIIGESGSGKSTLAEIISGIKEKTSGEVKFLGKEIGTNILASLNSIQIIFQDSSSAMNLELSIENILKEPFLLLKEKVPFPTEKMKEYLNNLGFPSSKEFLEKRAKNLSGGEMQRLNIVRALLLEPKLLIADEITSMLDPSRKANLLRILKGLQNKYGFSMLFITHDLILAQKITDYFYVLKEGKIVEEGDGLKIFNRASHPYTKKLVSSIIYNF